MKVAQGNVADRPFARTIFSLASKRFTGDLILSKARKDYLSSWENGQIVAAKSPSPADTPGRVALAHGLVNSSVLGIFVQEASAAPERDQTELLAEIAKLSPEQGTSLKKRVLARAAARMFALPGADFVVDNARSMRADPQVPPLDVRWLIYFGLRTHYSLERLAQELSAVGDRGLSLPAKALPMLPAFGFGNQEQPLLKRLMAQELSLANLVAATPDLDEATTTCVVYALMASSYLSFGAEQAPTVPRPQSPASTRARRGTVAGSSPAGPTAPQPERKRPARPSAQERTVQGVGFVDAKPQSPETAATVALISEKLSLLAKDVDYYSLLGVSDGASDSEVRSSYFQLARNLHPDRLRAVGVVNMDKDAQRLFAAINKAFAVLSNPKELFKYKKILAAGGEKAFAKKQQAAEDMAAKIFRAEEHHHIGEMALRRDQFAQAEKEFKMASELSPDESEYLALYAWAFYCNAKDRPAIESEAMSKMSSALLKGPKSVTTRLYHAKLLKLMGRKDEAIASFRKLMEMSPGHREGELELRILSKRETAETETKKGLFGRKR